jgi:hypothetical protein
MTHDINPIRAAIFDAALFFIKAVCTAAVVLAAFYALGAIAETATRVILGAQQ